MVYGFGTPLKPLYSQAKTRYGLTFRPDQFAHWDVGWGHNYLTLAHMHGSVSYACYPSDQRMAHARPFELVQTNDPVVARATWRWPMEGVASGNTELEYGGITPLVSGLRKSEKLNIEPFANYFSAFSQAV